MESAQVMHVCIDKAWYNRNIRYFKEILGISCIKFKNEFSYVSTRPNLIRTPDRKEYYKETGIYLQVHGKGVRRRLAVEISNAAESKWTIGAGDYWREPEVSLLIDKMQKRLHTCEKKGRKR